MYALLTTLLLAAAPEAGATPEAALLKTFREEFVAITPGMDKFPATIKRQSDTVPAPPPYLIAKYEVPQNLWAAVMGSNPSRWKGPRNSVEMLSFADAEDFCRRATEKLRAAKLIEPTQTVRLPTELEWEYAARASSSGRYSFGDDLKLLDAHAWHTGNAAGNDPAVGVKKPNAWGLYDEHGYLWEWCTVATEAGAPAPAEQALRGGSWKDPGEQLAIDFRRLAKPDLRDDAVGLRCVLTMPTGGAATGK